MGHHKRNKSRTAAAAAAAETTRTPSWLFMLVVCCFSFAVVVQAAPSITTTAININTNALNGIRVDQCKQQCLSERKQCVLTQCMNTNHDARKRRAKRRLRRRQLKVGALQGLAMQKKGNKNKNKNSKNKNKNKNKKTKKNGMKRSTSNSNKKNKKKLTIQNKKNNRESTLTSTTSAVPATKRQKQICTSSCFDVYDECITSQCEMQNPITRACIQKALAPEAPETPDGTTTTTTTTTKSTTTTTTKSTNTQFILPICLEECSLTSTTSAEDTSSDAALLKRATCRRRCYKRYRARIDACQMTSCRDSQCRGRDSGTCTRVWWHAAYSPYRCCARPYTNPNNPDIAVCGYQPSGNRCFVDEMCTSGICMKGKCQPGEGEEVQGNGSSTNKIPLQMKSTKPNPAQTMKKPPAKKNTSMKRPTNKNQPNTKKMTAPTAKMNANAKPTVMKMKTTPIKMKMKATSPTTPQEDDVAETTAMKEQVQSFVRQSVIETKSLPSLTGTDTTSDDTYQVDYDATLVETGIVSLVPSSSSSDSANLIEQVSCTDSAVAVSFTQDVAPQRLQEMFPPNYVLVVDETVYGPCSLGGGTSSGDPQDGNNKKYLLIGTTTRVAQGNRVVIQGEAVTFHHLFQEKTVAYRAVAADGGPPSRGRKTRTLRAHGGRDSARRRRSLQAAEPFTFSKSQTFASDQNRIVDIKPSIDVAGTATIHSLSETTKFDGIDTGNTDLQIDIQAKLEWGYEIRMKNEFKVGSSSATSNKLSADTGESPWIDFLIPNSSLTYPQGLIDALEQVLLNPTGGTEVTTSTSTSTTPTTIPMASLHLVIPFKLEWSDLELAQGETFTYTVSDIIVESGGGDNNNNKIATVSIQGASLDRLNVNLVVDDSTAQGEMTPTIVDSDNIAFTIPSQHETTLRELSTTTASFKVHGGIVPGLKVVAPGLAEGLIGFHAGVDLVAKADGSVEPLDPILAAAEATPAEQESYFCDQCHAVEADIQFTANEPFFRTKILVPETSQTKTNEKMLSDTSGGPMVLSKLCMADYPTETTCVSQCCTGDAICVMEGAEGTCCDAADYGDDGCCLDSDCDQSNGFVCQANKCVPDLKTLEVSLSTSSQEIPCGGKAQSLATVTGYYDEQGNFKYNWEFMISDKSPPDVKQSGQRVLFGPPNEQATDIVLLDLRCTADCQLVGIAPAMTIKAFNGADTSTFDLAVSCA